MTGKVLELDSSFLFRSCLFVIFVDWIGPMLRAALPEARYEYFHPLEVPRCSDPHVGSASTAPLPGLVPIPSSVSSTWGLNGLLVISSLLLNQSLRSVPWAGDDGEGDFESEKPVIDLVCMLGVVHPAPLPCNREASGLLQRGLSGLLCHP